MKFLLLISLMLLFLVGCESDPVSGTDPELWIGTWSGTSYAVYPGDADQEVNATENIIFQFSDSTFEYFWTDGTGGDSIPYGMGKYSVGDSTIMFSEVLLSGFYEPMNLQGEFYFGFVDSTLSLTQHAWPNNFFQTYHLVTLDKIDTLQLY